MKRKNFFDTINDIKLNDLPRIKTLGELRASVGKVLIFGHTSILNPYFVWMGTLDSVGRDECTDNRSVADIEVRLTNFIVFLNSRNSKNYLNPLKNTQSEFRFDPNNHYSDAQEFICVPDKKLLLYYNLCVSKCSQDKK